MNLTRLFLEDMAIAEGQHTEPLMLAKRGVSKAADRKPGYKDFTLADFAQLPEQERQVLLAKAVAEPMRAAAHMAMLPEEVYAAGSDVRDAVFRFFEVPSQWARIDPKGMGKFLPVEVSGYWNYVHDKVGDTGLSTKLHLTAKIEGAVPRYTPTSFGLLAQGFVSNMLSALISDGIDPRDLFGTASKRFSEDPQARVLRFLLHLYENGEKSASAAEVATLLYGDPQHGVAVFLDRFERIGVVTYDSVNAKTGERKTYEINARWARRMVTMDLVDVQVCKQHHLGRDTMKRVVLGIANSRLTSMTGEQLQAFAPNNDQGSILGALDALKIIHLSRTRSSVSLTQRGRWVVEGAILPLIEAAKTPARLSATARYTLSEAGKRALINIYRKKKQRIGKGRKMVLKKLPTEGTGITAEELATSTGLNRSTVHDILTTLRKERLVVNVSDCRWLKVVQLPQKTAPFKPVKRGDAAPIAASKPRLAVAA